MKRTVALRLAKTGDRVPSPKFKTFSFPSWLYVNVSCGNMLTDKDSFELLGRLISASPRSDFNDPRKAYSIPLNCHVCVVSF